MPLPNDPTHLPIEIHDPAEQDEVTRVPLKIEDWLTVIIMGLLALITFANVLVRGLGKAIALSKDPQRSAAFKVLKQTHAPSVLVELGYMSNAHDEQQMSSIAWQKQVAGSIAAAVNTYFNKRTAEHP